jgi:hypothetical protein
VLSAPPDTIIRIYSEAATAACVKKLLEHSQALTLKIAKSQDKYDRRR